jgi:GT2 family glycosyltransferase
MLHFETPSQKKAYSQLQAKTPAALAEVVSQSPLKVLVVIPFRDKWTMTAECLAALAAQDLRRIHMLVALVDNGSVEAETAEGIKAALMQESAGVQYRHLRYDIPFNFSRLNNLAVQDCRDFGPHLVCFLNNDVVMTDQSTMRQMTTFLELHPNAGTVGCSLLYPDQTIQHLFIAVGAKIVGAHPYKGCKIDLQDSWYHSPRPVGAATAALIVMRSDLFDEVGGFEEALPSCYQDVDLALKVQRNGRVNWVLPWISAIHHETQTRSPRHAWEEVDLMYGRWGGFLTSNPYHSSVWSRWSEPLVFALGEGEFPWRLLKD